MSTSATEPAPRPPRAPRPRVRTRRALCGALALSALLVAPACKSTHKSPFGTPPKRINPNQPRRGGTITLPSNEPQYLNPILETRFDRANKLIFEGLVGLGPQLKLVPRLAASWKVSRDGKTITFKLRKGVNWQDGVAFTSRDVRFTYEAIKKTKAPSVWKAYMASVKDVKAPDPHTVVVEYASPYAPALATWTVGILPEHVYGKGKLVSSPGNKQPVGTGPYKLENWEIGKRIVLEANKNWWHGRPNIDTIVLDFNVRDQLAALEKHKLDFAEIRDLESWRKTQTSGFRRRFDASDVLEAHFRAIGWNTQKKPFSDPKVRIALTHALNRGRVIDDVLLGEARPLSAPLFPNMIGADPSIAPYAFDLDKAVKMLDAAGYPSKNGQRFAIDLIALQNQAGRPPANETLAIFRRDLSAIGIQLKVELLSTHEFFNRIVLRNFDAVYFGWLPDIPDPDPYALLHSSQIGTGANFAGIADAQVDKLLEEARSTANRDERKAYYHKLNARLHQLMPYTVLYAPLGHYAWSRRVRDVNPSDVGPQPRFPGVAGWWVVPITEPAPNTPPPPK